ncbi:MAG: hypothetical protein Q8N96_08340 [Methylovulum sp.]|nr:hypothetical protein [Methylovulum sp.]
METSYPKAEATRESLPITTQLLTAGGDARIALDVLSGLNAYGCRPYPDQELLDYGSSTASAISTAGYDCAGQLRQRLLAAINCASSALVYTREIGRVRMELLQLCGLPDSTRVIFSPSGTDVHSIAAQYAGSGATLPARIVMIEANETGRGVAAALDGSRLAENLGSHAPEMMPVSVRLDDGNPRPQAEIDAEVESLVSTALASGQRVLLILIDQSKTGLIAPSPRCVMALHHRFQDKIDVLVDACQFRIAPPTLRAYLEQGFMIALTGSKFLTGPSFSAALLISPQTAKQLQRRPFPAALIACSIRADWPSNWTMPEHLAQTANFGLLLRWEAALQELRLFCGLSQAFIIGFLHAFESAVQQRLNDDPFFEPLPVLKLDRRPLIAANNWDHLQTIFPFLLYHADAERTPLNAEETLQIYQQLPIHLNGTFASPIAALRCQLGQPVSCGKRNNSTVSALRLCVSARLIVKAAADNDNGTAVIADALAVLDKTTLLIQSLPKPDVSNHFPL